jgi:hypothetical protein
MADAHIWHAIDRLAGMVTLLGTKSGNSLETVHFGVKGTNITVDKDQRLAWLRQLMTDGTIEHPNYTWQFISINEDSVVILGTAVFGDHWVVFNIGHSGVKYTTQVWHVEDPIRLEPTSLQFDYAHEVIQYLNDRFPKVAATLQP